MNGLIQLNFCVCMHVCTQDRDPYFSACVFASSSTTLPPPHPNLSEYYHSQGALLCVERHLVAPGMARNSRPAAHDGYTPDSCSELKAKLVSCMLSQGMEVIVRYSSRTIL